MLRYKTLTFNTVTLTSYIFSPDTDNNLHAILVDICTSKGDPLSSLLKHTIYCLQKCSASVDVCQWVPFFQIHRSKSADMIKTLVKVCSETRPKRMTVCQVLFLNRLDVSITLRGDFPPHITLCIAAVTSFLIIHV